jgi:hypothetical protein
MNKIPGVILIAPNFLRVRNYTLLASIDPHDPCNRIRAALILKLVADIGSSGSSGFNVLRFTNPVVLSEGSVCKGGDHGLQELWSPLQGI